MEQRNTKDLRKNNAIQKDSAASVLNVQMVVSTLVVYWKWVVLSVIICLGLAVIYLRYASPVYTVSAKILIKDDDNTKNMRGSAIQNAMNLGIMSNSSGFDNEIEVLSTQSLAEEVVMDLKYYVSYYDEKTIKDKLVYKYQRYIVDIDSVGLYTIEKPAKVFIEEKDGKYICDVQYFYSPEPENIKPTGYNVSKTLTKLPGYIDTKLGKITIAKNPLASRLENDSRFKAVISNPKDVAKEYVANTSIDPSKKTTTIAVLTLQGKNPDMCIDYLTQLSEAYNRQANVDKNEIAVRTEQFINTRLEKIDKELGNTDGQIENYKRQKNVVDITANAAQSLTNTNSYEKLLTECNTQIMLLNSIEDYISQPANKYMSMPSNVGLEDAAATSLISEYNKLVMERKRMLLTASELSPAVQQYTSQLDDIYVSIKRALVQAKRNKEIERSSLERQVNRYNGMINQTPEQERVLTQIGRQQEVRSGLYLMLLQKREENSISLAATANKGRLLDRPVSGGKVKPKGMMVLLIALILGLGLPIGIRILLELLRFRIEGHDDVAKLTKLSIIADIPVASETAKKKADIVVHENRNDQMDEIFRSLRTNLQFILKEGEKVVMLTSITSGEGKTFIAANLAVSFALLGKKAILIGCDIRRPRLGKLFELNDTKTGITNLLAKNMLTASDVEQQIISSQVNSNLDLLLAGHIPPNPTELLARENLEVLIEILKEKYDYVVIDTAPVGLVTDTLSIGRVAHATVYVCRADYTEKASFRMLNDLVTEEKLKNVSIVINGIDMSKKKYGYAYGYGSSYKYGGYNYGYGYGYGHYSNSHYGNKDDDSIKK